MSTATQILTINNPAPIREIDDLVIGYGKATQSVEHRFEATTLMANAKIALQERLPDDFVKRLKSGAENCRLGFKTDRPDGYPVPVVRECIIEGLLTGVYPFGNEMNIIAGNSYITKEGFTGLMKRDGRFSDVRIEEDVPIYEDAKNGNIRAIVPFTASWKFEGKPDSLKGNIPIRVNRGMGDDAILGKAERKIRCRIWNQATGSVLTDGDAEDATNDSRAARARPVSGRVNDITRMTGGETVAVVDDDLNYGDPAPKATEPESAPQAPAAKPKADLAANRKDPAYKELLLGRCPKCGVHPDAVIGYAVALGAAPDDASSVYEIDRDTVCEILDEWDNLLPGLKERTDKIRAEGR
ncbi:MAG: hypothetical protein JW942_06870 [Opitutales bacterium]|nr:hypothetical protein [Opitutales bacterium]